MSGVLLLYNIILSCFLMSDSEEKFNSSDFHQSETCESAGEELLTSNKTAEYSVTPHSSVFQWGWAALMFR